MGSRRPGRGDATAMDGDMNEVVDDAAEETRAASRPLSPSGSAPRVVADRYITTAEIGRGGMGVVYQAFDPKLGREVALKCVRAAALDPEAEKRMAREARAMAKLNHPNVVGIFDVVADGPNLVLAMEFVRGLDLGAWLDRERRSPQEIVAKFVAAGRGLAAAHDCGLVHRDFKAGNVLVADDGRVLVTDFGLARFRMGLASDDLEPQDCDPTRDALPPGELE